MLTTAHHNILLCILYHQMNTLKALSAEILNAEAQIAVRIPHFLQWYYNLHYMLEKKRISYDMKT